MNKLNETDRLTPWRQITFYTGLAAFAGCLITILTLLLIWLLSLNTQTIYLDITSDSDQSLSFFWAVNDEKYDVKKSNTLWIRTGRHTYKYNRSQGNLDFQHVSQLKLKIEPQGEDLVVNEAYINAIGMPKIDFSVSGQSFRYDQKVLHYSLSNHFINYINSVLHLTKSRQQLYQFFVDSSPILVLFIAITIVCFRSNNRLVLTLSAVFLVQFVLQMLWNQHTTDFTIEVMSDQETNLQIFWSFKEPSFSEKYSATIPVQKGLHRYRAAIQNLNTIQHLRIDPSQLHGVTKIKNITIRELGYKDIVIDGSNQFKPIDWQQDASLRMEDDFLVITAKNNDPFFTFEINPDGYNKTFSIALTSFFILIFMVVLGVIYCSVAHSKQVNRQVFTLSIRAAFAIMALMVVQSAYFSGYDRHPDERAHINSTNYYTEYSMPPAVGDERSIHSYQYPWGISRLDSLSISYFFAGKMKAMMQWLSADSTFSARIFNVFLLAFCCVFALLNKQFAWFLLPVICTPQVGYLFSYANRGAFAFFICIFLGWQVANNQSSLQRFLQCDRLKKHWKLSLIPALLTGLLLIEQENYLVFLLFVFAALSYQWLFQCTHKKLFLTRLLLILLMSVSIYGVRKGQDIKINGLDKWEQQTQFAEKIAGPDFKPSVLGTDKSYYGLRLFQQGVSAWELFEPKWAWHTLTFKSFTGQYGNQFVVFSPQWYYDFVGLLFVIILLLAAYQLIKKQPLSVKFFTGLSLVFIFGAILMGFLFSWLYDFQAQGRYVFPLIPMAMIYFWEISPSWNKFERTAHYSCAFLLISLSIYSYRNLALVYLTEFALSF
ncbi:MAG: hypothetical protein V3U75_13975 [Methylococcaceae bacterium]